MWGGHGGAEVGSKGLQLFGFGLEQMNNEVIMKRLLLIIILVFPLSCYDGLSDMLDEVTMKVPVCVWDAAPGPVHDGRGWKNAYTTLADAVAAADEGDTIWVAGTQNLASTVTISKPLTILGGFSGTESRRDQRDVDNNKAVITGPGFSVIIDSGVNVQFEGLRFTGFTTSRAIQVDGNSNVITRECIFNNNSMAVRVSGSTYTAENCRFEDNAVTGSYGTAFYIDNSTVNIKDSIFDNNSTDQSGGAIYAVNNSNVTISDNTEFYRNSATGSSGLGGAVYATGSTVTISGSLFGDEFTAGSGNSAAYGGAVCGENSSTLTISNNTKFYRNNASHTAGAIRLNDNSVLNIDKCFFGGDAAGSGNIADYPSGAIAVYLHSTFNMTDCSFKENSAGTYGGAVHISESDSVIAGCNFKSNSALSNNGGALYFQASVSEKNLTIKRSDFDSNSANGSGGAIYFTSTGLNSGIVMESCIVRNTPTDNGSAVDINSASTNQFSNSLFYNNKYTASSTASGGALNINYSSLMVNLTFFNNSANTGGAVYLSGSPYYMYNTVFYDNTSIAGGANNTLNTNTFVTLNRYNCVYNTMSVSGGGDIEGGTQGNTSDPFLNSSDPSNSNFMRPGSILLDQGFTGTYQGGYIVPATDLAGNNREVGTIDIGAYERQ